MGRSQETFGKKEVRNKREKKRKEKAKKKEAKKESGKKSLDEMIAWVDQNGVIIDTPPDPTARTETKLEDIEVSVPKNDPSDKQDTSHKGVVSFFNDSKGYGFIRDLDTNQSIFVHINDIAEAIKEGNLVSFEIVSGQKGPAAKDVKIIK